MALRPRFSSPTSQPLRAVVVHHAGGVAVDAHLVLDRAAGDAVALAERAVRVDEELRHDEERDALGALRRALDAGEHEMDDVLGEVVLAGRDEDLGAGDRVGAVAVRHGLGLEKTEIGAAMRLGEVHRAGPCARRPSSAHRSASAPPSRAAAGRRSRPCVRPGYMANARLRRGLEFLHDGVERRGQALAAEFLAARESPIQPPAT